MFASTRSRLVIRRMATADLALNTALILRAGALVVPAFALLVGCSAMIGVHISGSLEQPVARFGNDPLKTERACVDTISVQEMTNARMAPVWSASTGEGRCRGLEQVVYGQAPKGFETTVEAVPLRAGVRYYVSASGRTGSVLMRVPWRGGGEYIFENGTWRPAGPRQHYP